jgi:hypothetical protein
VVGPRALEPGRESIPELAVTHRVIVMDQRNAGASTAPVTGEESWATYTADHLALPDHLGVDEFAVLVPQGDDIHHPRSASRLIAESVPGATLVERWKDDPSLPATIAEFLA